MKSLEVISVYIELLNKTLDNDQYEAAKTIAVDLKDYFQAYAAEAKRPQADTAQAALATEILKKGVKKTPDSDLAAQAAVTIGVK